VCCLFGWFGSQIQATRSATEVYRTRRNNIGEERQVQENSYYHTHKTENESNKDTEEGCAGTQGPSLMRTVIPVLTIVSASAVVLLNLDEFLAMM
jgi:hypothetical protein